MAGMMEFNELDSPMIENGGGLFGPDDDDDEHVVSPMGKVSRVLYVFMYVCVYVRVCM